jgi:hypothetical protein
MISRKSKTAPGCIRRRSEPGGKAMRNHGPFLLLIVVVLGWRVKIIIARK